MEREIIEQIVAKVLLTLNKDLPRADWDQSIPVGVSNRHIHLSGLHLAVLFGQGYTLTKLKDLKQAGEFAAAETVTLVGPKGVLREVRILGPVRTVTQVELSRTDGYLLGVNPPVRDSGDIKGSAGLSVVGPCGAITLAEGVICAARHIHMPPEDAARFAVGDGDRVAVEAPGPRGGRLGNVLVRVRPHFRLEFHIDTDEANALGLSNNDRIRLLSQ